ERSHWSGNGVHVEPESVFMIGRNMQKQSFLPHRSSIFCAMSVVLVLLNRSVRRNSARWKLAGVMVRSTMVNDIRYTYVKAAFLGRWPT
ncbi:hypothetical protein, partial [Aeromonas sp. JL9]|uniref:hypothetical protein n=1 Tax=Aeromonas sp. JL9 TaxID=2950549 RepID=UPI00210A43D0